MIKVTIDNKSMLSTTENIFDLNVFKYFSGCFIWVIIFES